MTLEGHTFFRLKANVPSPQQVVLPLAPNNAPPNLGHHLRAHRQTAAHLAIAERSPSSVWNEDTSALTAYVAQDAVTQQPGLQQRGPDPCAGGADPRSSGGTPAPLTLGAAFLAQEQEVEEFSGTETNSSYDEPNYANATVEFTPAHVDAHFY